MDPILEKLQYKDEDRVLVTNAPDSFSPFVEALRATARVDERPARGARYRFVIAFAQRLDQVERVAAMSERSLAEDDPTVWVSYPKASSKRYHCEFNRDTGWTSLGDAGFEAVRQVAIDEDWSALRFRRVEHIRSIRRDRTRAMTPEGKRRATGLK